MLGNIGPMQLLIIFLIVLLIFGTKKLRNVGGDLGSAIRDFRKGVSEGSTSEDEKSSDKQSDKSDKRSAKTDDSSDDSKS